jgi:hypothetical protein
MLVYTTEPSSPSHDALSLLGSWATSPTHDSIDVIDNADERR